MDELSRERLAFDPIYKHAQKAADDLIDGHYTKVNAHRDEARQHIAEYRSKTQRLQFLDALRKEMMLWMERHRPGCGVKDNPERCRFEVHYADIVRIIQDELEVLDPSVASRPVSGSFSRQEADEVVKLLNDMRDQLQTMEATLQTGQQVTYDLLSEELDDLPLKLSLGKKDFGAVFLGRIKEAALKKGIELALIEPLVAELTKIVETR